MSIESTLADRKEREQQKREALASDFRFVLSTQHGRRLLWHIIEDICHREAVVAGESAFLEGQRSVGVQLAASAKAIDFRAYQLMEREDFDSRLAETANGRTPERAITEDET
jgi:hypothetical protein